MSPVSHMKIQIVSPTTQTDSFLTDSDAFDLLPHLCSRYSSEEQDRRASIVSIVSQYQLIVVFTGGQRFSR